MLVEHIKRNLFKCKDIGPEPEFNKNPFWDEPKESTVEKLRGLIDERQDKQAE